MTLLYIGIAPRPPAKNGSISRSTLRSRLRQHECLGLDTPSHTRCLLAERLGIELRRVRSGSRMTFGVGEQKLSVRMEANAFVTWIEHPAPSDLEPDLIRELRPPLNLAENTHHPFCEQLSRIRSEAKARARSMDVLPDGFKL